MKKVIFALALVPLLCKEVSAQLSKKEACQKLLDSFLVAGNYPGLSLSVRYGDGDHFSIVSGMADKEKQVRLTPAHAMLQGSVGKTYVAAVALQLMKQRKINLEDKASRYLGHYAWYNRIPNAGDITIRMLMNHTSGVMRYEFKEAFTRDLTANPAKQWTPAELLHYILDEKASFPAGTDWEYSDSNFILLGMIIEEVTGQKYYDILRKNILEPFGLKETFPSDNRKLPALAPGYAGPDNPFGGKDKMIGEDGLFVINPQFEWTGGGIYSTTADLARWGLLLYEGKVVDTSTMIWYAVPAKLGRATKYGLGVIVRETSLGPGYGHSGYFPGYLTEMLYFPSKRMCIALQANSSDFKSIKVGLLRVLMAVAQAAGS